LLCRVSLEPDSCVKRTESTFTRRGPITLVLAKFVPGLSTVAPPLAGLVGMRWPAFLALDALGALLWTAAFVAPGWVLRDQLEVLAARAALTGTWLLGIVGGLIALFVAVKVVRRQLFLRQLRVARITVDQLSELLAGAAPPFVVDLRKTHDFEADPR